MESSKTATFERTSGTSTKPQRPSRPAGCSTASIPAEFEEETLEVYLLDPAPLEWDKIKVCTVI